MLAKMWTPVSTLDETLMTAAPPLFAFKETCDEFLSADGMSLFYDSRLVEVNQDALTEVGEATKERIIEHCKNAGIVNLRFSPGVQWLAKSADERMQMVYELVTLQGEPIDIAELDSDVEQVDFKKPFEIQDGKIKNV